MTYTSQTIAAFSDTLGAMHSAVNPVELPPASQLARDNLGYQTPLTDDEAYLVELLETHRRTLTAPQVAAMPASLTAPVNVETAEYFRLRKTGLTRRECEVVFWVAQGKRDAEIAVLLGCAPKTVGKHVENLLLKLGAETRLAAAHTVQEWLRQHG